MKPTTAPIENIAILLLDCGVSKTQVDHIVRAVNSYQAMRRALEEIDRLAGCQSSNYTDLSLAIGECRTLARAALDAGKE